MEPIGAALLAIMVALPTQAGAGVRRRGKVLSVVLEDKENLTVCSAGLCICEYFISFASSNIEVQLFNRMLIVCVIRVWLPSFHFDNFYK